MKSISCVWKIAPVLLALLMAGSVASAEESTAKERKPSKATLEKYDSDRDGKMSEEEKARAKAGAQAKAKATREENLAKYDVNKDGKLDDEEKARKKADDDAAKDARKEAKAAGKK